MANLTFTPKAGGEDWTADVSAELHRHNGYDVVLFLDKVAKTDDSGWMLELAIEADGTVNGQITSDPGNDCITVFDSQRHQLRLFTDSGTVPACVITADGEPPDTLAVLREAQADAVAYAEVCDRIDALMTDTPGHSAMCTSDQPVIEEIEGIDWADLARVLRGKGA